MKAIAVIVGINYWQGITEPFARKLRDYNPGLDIFIVDNASAPCYPPLDGTIILRLEQRSGYNLALNAGLKAAGMGYDWYILFNNDCDMYSDGNIFAILERLDKNTLYGSGENYDVKQKLMWQWSAWLVISRRILRKVGLFDPELTAGFEDFDYEQRARLAGFALATAHLPVFHLDKHTRYLEDNYQRRWEACRQYFNKKHNLECEPWRRQ